MTRREWVLVELNRRLGLAAAATPGPWRSDGNAVRTVDGPLRTYALALTYPSSSDKGSSRRYHHDAVHIAASDPSRLGALYGWMRGEVGRHEYRDGGAPATEPRPIWYHCFGCGENFIYRTQGAACPFVRSLADALGYREDGTCSKCGLPTTGAHCFAFDPPPAVAASPHAEGEPEPWDRCRVTVDGGYCGLCTPCPDHSLPPAPSVPGSTEGAER